MRFFHLSDLHIGKQMHFYNLADDQRYILNQIVDRAQELRPDAVLIAGDIYDKTIPSGEAYRIFDEFLNRLGEITPAIPVLIIAGNHDSAHRLQYASSFLEKHQIYVAAMPPEKETDCLKKVVLRDTYGAVNFWLFPFIKPGYVRHLFDEGVVTDYESAFRGMLEREMTRGNLDYAERNVLVAHQFFTAGGSLPQTCDSELASVHVGGLDRIDTSVISAFDYAALGHIHGAQSIGSERIRYSGTPLKYSVSEEHHDKAITLVTLGEKGELTVEAVSLESLHDVRRIKGTMQEILETARTEEVHRQDYVSIVLTDEKEVYRPKEVLSEAYPNILEIMVDNARTKAIHSALGRAHTDTVRMPSPMEAFREFYQLMQRQPMAEAEERVLEDILKDAQEEIV